MNGFNNTYSYSGVTNFNWAHSSGTSEYLSPGTEADIEYLLRDDAPTDMERISNVLAEMRRIQSMQRTEEHPSTTPQGVVGGIHTGYSRTENNLSDNLEYHQLHPVHF